MSCVAPAGSLPPGMRRAALCGSRYWTSCPSCCSSTNSSTRCVSAMAWSPCQWLPGLGWWVRLAPAGLQPPGVSLLEPLGGLLSQQALFPPSLLPSPPSLPPSPFPPPSPPPVSSPSLISPLLPSLPPSTSLFLSPSFTPPFLPSLPPRPRPVLWLRPGGCHPCPQETSCPGLFVTTLPL